MNTGPEGFCILLQKEPFGYLSLSDVAYFYGQVIVLLIALLDIIYTTGCHSLFNLALSASVLHWKGILLMILPAPRLALPTASS